jgi:hypothetical protein
MSEADGTTDQAWVEAPDIGEKALTVHPDHATLLYVLALADERLVGEHGGNDTAGLRRRALQQRSPRTLSDTALRHLWGDRARRVGGSAVERLCGERPVTETVAAPAVVDEGNVTTYLSSTANAGVDQEGSFALWIRSST